MRLSRHRALWSGTRPAALAAALLATLAGAPAFALEVLSAGAVEPGLAAAADAFRRSSGSVLTIRYATAPVLRQKVTAGEAAGVVIAL